MSEDELEQRIRASAADAAAVSGMSVASCYWAIKEVMRAYEPLPSPSFSEIIAALEANRRIIAVKPQAVGKFRPHHTRKSRR